MTLKWNDDGDGDWSLDLFGICIVFLHRCSRRATWYAATDFRAGSPLAATNLADAQAEAVALMRDRMSKAIEAMNAEGAQHA